MVCRPLGHAAVLGGSIAGLLAVRVLSDHSGRVTLIERDKLADIAATSLLGTRLGRDVGSLLLPKRPWDAAGALWV
jgi:glycine/D-amino acid oxidase-like deaminating enzyme